MLVTALPELSVTAEVLLTRSSSSPLSRASCFARASAATLFFAADFAFGEV